MADNQGIPFSTPDEGVSYPDLALTLVRNHVRDQRRASRDVPPQEADDFKVYVVWFAKTLRNWKALVSTSIPDGAYYEVTFNGTTRVAYVDTYVKVSNHVVQFP